MLSKKLVLSILLLVCFVNVSEQLTISKADQEKISKKIEQLSLSDDTKNNIKSKLGDLLKLFTKENNATKIAEVCTEPKWCEGFKVDACKIPETNKTACCLFCTEDASLETTTEAEKNVTIVAETTTTIETTTASKFRHRTTTVSDDETSTATTTLETTTTMTTSPQRHRHRKIKTTTMITTTLATTTFNPAMITLPAPIEYDYDSSSDIPGLDDDEKVESKSRKTTTTATTTTVKPEESATTEKALSKKFKEVILDIDESDPNEIVLWKKTFERIPKDCPKEVGFTGCSIIEKCKNNSDCTKSGEKCCLRDCVRTCISI
jgi:hypothetical protein